MAESVFQVSSEEEQDPTGRPPALTLARPTFLASLTSKPAKTEHDEYWHPHIDRIAYPEFDVTGLLYLGDHGKDWEDGGRFVFLDGEGKGARVKEAVYPKRGDLLLFSSGRENPHRVERVVGKGRRNALTIAFKCDDGKSPDNMDLFASSLMKR